MPAYPTVLDHGCYELRGLSSAYWPLEVVGGKVFHFVPCNLTLMTMPICVLQTIPNLQLALCFSLLACIFLAFEPIDVLNLYLSLLAN